MSWDAYVALHRAFGYTDHATVFDMAKRIVLHPWGRRREVVRAARIVARIRENAPAWWQWAEFKRAAGVLREKGRR